MLLTGCQSGDSTEEQITETVNVFQALPLPDVYIEIPEGYEKKSSQFYQEYYTKDTASIIVTQDTSQPSYSSNRDFATSALMQYKQTTKSLNYIGEDWIESGIYNVYVLEFSYTVGEDVPEMTAYIGYLTNGYKMFIITCSAESTDYPNHKNEFRQVLSSVRITE